MRIFQISRFNNARDRWPKPDPLSWAGLCKLLTTHREREQKDGPLWSPANYPLNAGRGMVNVTGLCCVVADVDSGASYEDAYCLMENWLFIAHSSYSHTPKHPKFRIILPLAEDIPNSQWGIVWPRLRLLLAFGGVKIDQSCSDSSRIYYLPACPPGAERFAEVHQGKPLDVNELPKPPPPPVKVWVGKGERPGVVKPAELLTMARDRAIGNGGRNIAGFWLACQLRDNQVSEPEAEGYLTQFAESVTSEGEHPYTVAEALSGVKQAYRHLPREPWHEKVTERIKL